jgi:hypothetical protein
MPTGRYPPAGLLVSQIQSSSEDAHIVGAIIEEADYRGPVDDQEFTDAHRELGRPLPAAWQAYLQGASRLRRGWLTSGTFVQLYTPYERLELLDASGPTTDAHPGMAIIGGDEGREQLVLDLRSDPAPVLQIDVTNSGWDDAIRQSDGVSELIDRIEAGTFTFEFGASGWPRPGAKQLGL